MRRVFSLSDFRLLFAGSTTSLLGDQFSFIATPWLVLQLTGDPLALGTVLALGGIPRAVFILLGGAVTDRLSPRLLMLISDLIRLGLTALMALAVFTGGVQLWMLYLYSLGFGLVAGFAIPAQNSIVPMLVAEGELQAGNSLMMGVSQLVGFIGPTVAGILIGRFSQSPLGIGLAYAIDSASFLVSALCLWRIGRAGRQKVSAGKDGETVWRSILAGVHFLWDDRPMRMMFLVVVAMNFFFVGPLLVGIPVLADTRLPEGAVAFGLLMSAYAGGNLAGYILAGTLPRPGGRMMRNILISLLVIFGLVIAAIGWITSTWLDFALMLLLGLGNGYISITLFTWMQLRTPREMLGRMMSLLMLSNVGLVPISQAVAGAVSKFSLSGLFIGAGGLVLLVAGLTVTRPELTTFSQNMAAGAPAVDPGPPGPPAPGS